MTFTLRAGSALFALVALLFEPLPAQNIFVGNGIPSAYIANTPAVVGNSLTFEMGSPTAPSGIGVLSLSGGIGPTVAPVVGLVGLDVNHPFYAVLLVFLDGNGDTRLTLPLSPTLGTAGSPPFFANMLTVEAGLALSISKTVRVEWANANGWESVSGLGGVRQDHQATALGDGPRDNVTDVLITGGATGSIIVPTSMATAELYEPLTRTVRPLPSMSLPRSGHRARRLQDGRVLICGGVTTGGVVTPTCEFFDPSTRMFTPAPSMSAPRAGFAMTVLDDGRVLVSGGVADWQNAATAFVAALNTAQNTAEVFDPVSNSWSPLPNMAGKRAGHSQTKLLDGRVLVASGISGGVFSGSTGQVPTFTPSCEVFDPATNTFAPTAPLNFLAFPFPVAPRGFHGASLLPNGDVLVTGGFESGSSLQGSPAQPTATCAVWNGSTWTAVASLPVPIANHGQVAHGTGALITGGYIGDLTQLLTTANVGLHDGTTYTALAPMGTDGGSGTAEPRATHSLTPLYDGTFLVYGGARWPATLGDGWVYTPN